MKHRLLITMIFCLGLILTACGGATGANNTTGTAAAASTSSGALSAAYAGALPVETQLAFGTLQLEGSPNAISAENAAQLLPLWKAVRSLSASDAAAAEEIQAVYRQIEESMSAGQLQAIAAMQLTSSDVARLAGEMGVNMGAAGAPRGTPDATMQAAAASQASQGAQIQMGADGPPADFAGGVPGEMPGMGSGSSSTSGSTSGADANAANPILDAVITYLQSKLA